MGNAQFHLAGRPRLRHCILPQSSPASPLTAGAAGFLTLTQFIGAAGGDVSRAHSLGDDALAAELAGVLEDFHPVAVQMLGCRRGSVYLNYFLRLRRVHYSVDL